MKCQKCGGPTYGDNFICEKCRYGQDDLADSLEDSGVSPITILNQQDSSPDYPPQTEFGGGDGGGAGASGSWDSGSSDSGSSSCDSSSSD